MNGIGIVQVLLVHLLGVQAGSSGEKGFRFVQRLYFTAEAARGSRGRYLYQLADTFRTLYGGNSGQWWHQAVAQCLICAKPGEAEEHLRCHPGKIDVLLLLASILFNQIDKLFKITAVHFLNPQCY